MMPMAGAARAGAVVVAALALAAPAVAGGLADLEARGASCFADRARGFAATGRIDPEPAHCAAAAWSAAADLAPERVDLACRAIEALWFAAHFATTERSERQALLERAVTLADLAVERQPRSGEARFWATVAWGEWGMEHGNLAALARGVPERLREHAELAAELAPDLRGGGGLRLLGRMHATMPRIPFVTRWVDRERGRVLLREAFARGPHEPRNALFLAEALLDAGGASRAEALELLGELTRRAPSADRVVEESEVLAEARRRLDRERASR